MTFHSQSESPNLLNRIYNKNSSWLLDTNNIIGQAERSVTRALPKPCARRKKCLFFFFFVFFVHIFIHSLILILHGLVKLASLLYYSILRLIGKAVKQRRTSDVIVVKERVPPILPALPPQHASVLICRQGLGHCSSDRRYVR